jgi:hypothetical protein
VSAEAEPPRKKVTDEHVKQALSWLRWRHSAGSISAPHEWVNDPADFEWEQRLPHAWALVYVPQRRRDVCYVTWDERHGWDAYGYLTHSYIGMGSHGEGPDAMRAAMGLALDHALCNPVKDAWDPR